MTSKELQAQIDRLPIDDFDSPECKRLHNLLANIQAMEGQKMRMLQKACIPARFQGPLGKSDDLFNPSVVRWQAEFDKIKSKVGTGFLIGLVGGRGAGKTRLGVELIKDRIQTNFKSALYEAEMDFFLECVRPNVDKADMVDRLARPQLLVLDEWGKKGGSDFEFRMLFGLLDRRYRDMLDTVIISNDSEDVFVESLGDSLASRMRETGGIIVCDWPSFRK